jgi:hypothetical protein
MPSLEASHSLYRTAGEFAEKYGLRGVDSIMRKSNTSKFVPRAGINVLSG